MSISPGGGRGGAAASSAVSQPLERALDILAKRAESEQLRSLAADVLAKRRPISALLASSEFKHLGRTGAEAFDRELHAMSAQQREALHQGALALARSRGVIAEHEEPYELRWGDVSFDDNQSAR